METDFSDKDIKLIKKKFIKNLDLKEKMNTTLQLMKISKNEKLTYDEKLKEMNQILDNN